MKKSILIGVLLLTLFAVSWSALAQDGDNFAVPWFSVDGVGRTSVGGEFVLNGVIGQADASNPYAGGEFTLTGGFQAWLPGHDLPICGDLHPAGGGDGDVDVLDALRALRISVGAVTPDEREATAGDVHPDNEPDPDGDGDNDVLDALRILKEAVGLVHITSCGGPAP